MQTVFAIVGIRVFSGTFRSCTDASLVTRERCLERLCLELPAHSSCAYTPAVSGAYTPAVSGHAGRVLRGGGGSSRGRARTIAGEAPPMWLNPPAGSFDSFGEAMLALFVATTGDNMPDLMWAGEIASECF